MAKRVDVIVAMANSAHRDGAATNYLIQANNGALYVVYIESGGTVVFRKSTDGGFTWSPATTIYSTNATVTQLSVWYDRWSNIAADLIHCVYVNSTDDDVQYRTIDTASSDGLSTQTTVAALTSTAANGHMSVSRAVGGNVYVKVIIDNGAEGGFYRLPNANVPNGAWDAARTIDEAAAGSDQMILLPDFDAADTQDMLAIFWDASANEVSRKLYDDSANSWAETSIATSMVELIATTAWPNFAAAMDIANTQHVLVAWSDTDLATARLRCWTVDSGAITAKTDVVSSSTDDQGLCAVGIDTDTGYWYVAYCGKTDGSETWNSDVKTYYKVSQDSGSTWGPETQLSGDGLVTLNFSPSLLLACPRFTGGEQGFKTLRTTVGVANGIRINLALPARRALHQVLG